MLFTPLLKSKNVYLRNLFVNFWHYVWLVFKSGLWWPAYGIYFNLPNSNDLNFSILCSKICSDNGKANHNKLSAPSPFYSLYVETLDYSSHKIHFTELSLCTIFFTKGGFTSKWENIRRHQLFFWPEFLSEFLIIC